MAERFKAHAWKVCVPSQVPWVRIPLSPPLVMVIKKHSKKWQCLVSLNYTFNIIVLHLILRVNKIIQKVTLYI